MRHLTALLLVLLLCRAASAAFALIPLPSPPRPEEIGEIVFERSDWHANDDEHVTMSREEFLDFFTAGTFRNRDPDSIYKSTKYAKPLNERGGWQTCKGAFATKSGKVFFFSRPRKGVLEIEDHQHRTGWLILDPKR